MNFINMETWSRRELFSFMSAVKDPFYAVTYTQDVTNLYRYAKAQGLPFYYALTFLVSKAMNRVENFRYVIADGKVALHEELYPSFTDLHKGNEEFHIVTLPAHGTMVEFCAAAREKSERQTTFINMDEEGKNLIFISCAPWIDITGLTNEGMTDPDDNIPRISWGKFRLDGERRTLGMALELNHRFIDGLHVGRFAEELTRLIEAL